MKDKASLMSGGVDGTSLLRGLLASLAASVLLSIILALVLNFSSVVEGDLDLFLNYLGMVAVLAGGAVSTLRLNRLGWLHGGMVGVLYVLLCYFVGLAVFPDLIPLSLLLSKLLAGAVLGALGGMIGINL